MQKFISVVIVLFWSCNEEYPAQPHPEEVLRLPVVVHVLHHGEAIGKKGNLSEARIIRQIEILNEDFRRKTGTRGYNDHPDGGDSRIEFILAKRDPSGSPSTGIERIDITKFSVPNLGYHVNHFAQYSYWKPDQYINIWTTPLPESTACLVLGHATGPETDLPGTHLLAIPKPGDAEGILINNIHFGEADLDCHARHGRTLTHEMGHFLGLLHTWGERDCKFNDYCDDTPAVDDFVWGNISYTGCSGEPVMIGNYMNYADDAVMNIFTKNQIARMHYVLKNHVGRHSLLISPALIEP